jgi:hypothetical protein
MNDELQISRADFHYFAFIVPRSNFIVSEAA